MLDERPRRMALQITQHDLLRAAVRDPDLDDVGEKGLVVETAIQLLVTERHQSRFTVAAIDDARHTPLPTQPPAFGTSLARAYFRIQIKGIDIARSKYPSITSGSSRKPAAYGTQSIIENTNK